MSSKIHLLVFLSLLAPRFVLAEHDRPQNARGPKLDEQSSLPRTSVPTDSVDPELAAYQADIKRVQSALNQAYPIHSSKEQAKHDSEVENHQTLLGSRCFNCHEEQAGHFPPNGRKVITYDVKVNNKLEVPKPQVTVDFGSLNQRLDRIWSNLPKEIPFEKGKKKELKGAELIVWLNMLQRMNRHLDRIQEKEEHEQAIAAYNALTNLLLKQTTIKEPQLRAFLDMGAPSPAIEVRRLVSEIYRLPLTQKKETTDREIPHTPKSEKALEDLREMYDIPKEEFERWIKEAKVTTVTPDKSRVPPPRPGRRQGGP